jgi:hypothetical protein
MTDFAAAGPSPGPFEPRYGEYSPYEKQLFIARLNDLKRAYRVFRDTKLKDTGKEWPFWINESILITVCFLYLNDLKEFKVFHDVDTGTDHLKRCAYISRWISNMRPIEFDKSYKINNPNLLNLNEEYAIFIFFLYLGINMNSIELPILEAISRDLKYIFKFRDPQRELLVSLARAIEAAVKAELENRSSRTAGTGASST